MSGSLFFKTVPWCKSAVNLLAFCPSWPGWWPHPKTKSAATCTSVYEDVLSTLLGLRKCQRTALEQHCSISFEAFHSVMWAHSNYSDRQLNPSVIFQNCLESTSINQRTSEHPKSKYCWGILAPLFMSYVTRFNCIFLFSASLMLQHPGPHSKGGDWPSQD